MNDKQLITYFNKYVKERMEKDVIISVAGFKKYLLQKKVIITELYKMDAWSGVRGQLEVYYEDFLTEVIVAGGRNSQQCSTLLTKFYDKQSRRGEDIVPVKIVLDFTNVGSNSIKGEK